MEMARKNLESPAGRNFKLGQVQSHQQVTAQVERCFIILSESEFKKEFSRKKTSRDPSVPTSWVVGPTGEPEEVYLFRDAANPHRRLRIVSSMGETQELQRMSREMHCHEDQPQHVWEAGVEESWQEWQLKSVLGQQGSYCTTIAEYKEKLKKKYLAECDAESEQVMEEKTLKKQQSSRSLGACSGRSLQSDGDDDERSMGDKTEDEGGDEKSDAECSHGRPGIRASASSGKKKKAGSDAASAAGSTTPPSCKKSLLELFNQQEGEEIPEGVSLADGQKWLSKPDGQLTDEQLLVKHRVKTPVMGALTGSKLGVQAKFAKEAARRMAPTLRAQLQGHLQLFEFAVSLSPGEIEKQNVQDIKQAVKALEGKVKEWPAAVQKAMHKRHTQQLLAAALAEGGVKPLQEVLDAVRPLPEEEAAAESLDIMQPKLRVIDATVKEKKQLFQSLLVDGLLIPIIDDGASSQIKFKQVVSTLAPFLEGLLLQDVPDEMVDTLAEIRQFLEACGVLFLQDPFQKLQSIGELQKLSQMFRTVGSNPLVLLANSLGGNAHYREMVEQCLEQVLKMKTHEEKIDMVKSACDKPFDNHEDVNKCCESLTEMVKNMCFLMEEIMLEIVQPLAEQVKQKVMGFWAMVWQGCEVEKPCLVSLESLQLLMMESAIAYPHEAKFTIMRGELAELLQKQGDHSTVKGLQEAFQKFVDMLEVDVSKAVEMLPSVQDKISAAKGVNIKGPSTTWVQSGLGKMLEKTGECFNTGPGKAKQMYDCMLALTELSSMDTIKAELAEVKLVLNMQEAHQALVRCYENLDELLEKDPEFKKIAEMMRRKMEAESAAMLPLASSQAWVKQQKEQLMDVTTKELEKVKDWLLKHFAGAIGGEAEEVGSYCRGHARGSLVVSICGSFYFLAVSCEACKRHSAASRLRCIGDGYQVCV